MDKVAPYRRGSTRTGSFFFFQICVTGMVQAARTYLQAEVTDPFIELHTGPGKGYPIFHVVERGERIEILKRKTDWFKVRTRTGKEGWVSRAQMGNTLVDAGVKRSFRDTVLDKHERQRFEVGFAAGVFDNDPVIKMRAGMRVLEHLLVELSFGQISGDFASSRQIDANLLVDPFPDWRASPFFSLGVGQFKSTPKGTIVQGQTTEDTAANAGVGVRVRLGRRFAFRADLRSYVILVNENRNEDFQELTVGFSFVF